MGYLIGFLIAAYFSGNLNFNNKLFTILIKHNKFWATFLYIFYKLIFSVSFIYILGLLWLGTLIGWDKPIFKLGAEPFLLAELFKITLLTFLYPWIIKMRKII